MPPQPAVILLTLLGLAAAPGFASSSDTLEQDMEICIQLQGSKEQVVAACTRLIDAAAAENPVVGYFYAMRASVNDDRASNCRDANKVLELADDARVVEAAKSLVELNC